MKLEFNELAKEAYISQSFPIGKDGECSVAYGLSRGHYECNFSFYLYNKKNGTITIEQSLYKVKYEDIKKAFERFVAVVSKIKV